MYRTTFSEVSTLRPGWLFNTSFDCLAHVFTVYLPLYCTHGQRRCNAETALGRRENGKARRKKCRLCPLPPRCHRVEPAPSWALCVFYNKAHLRKKNYNRNFLLADTLVLDAGREAAGDRTRAAAASGAGARDSRQLAQLPPECMDSASCCSCGGSGGGRLGMPRTARAEAGSVGWLAAARASTARAERLGWRS